MSMWNQIIAHPPSFERIKTLYNEQFPLEVRFVCAAWIEERIKVDLLFDINDCQIEQRACNFLHSLIQQLIGEKEKFQRAEELSIKYRLDGAIQTFTQHLHHPFAIYKQIREAISYEQYFLSKQQRANYEYQEAVDQEAVNEEAVNIKNKLQTMENEVQLNKQRQIEYKHEIEQYKGLESNIEYSESIEQTLQLSSIQLQERRSILDAYKRKAFQMIESINSQAIELHKSFANIIVEIDAVQKHVIVKRLGKWQRDQALVGNGAPVGNTLDEIQSWFEKLADIIWTTRCSIEATREINKGFAIGTSDVLEQSYNDITTLLKDLVVSGFIVEKQPPQVMKSLSKFDATVRLLPSNIQLHNPSVVVSILSECQAEKQLKESYKPIDEASGEILNNKGNLQLEQSTRRSICYLRHMQLKKFKRPQKKATASVKDEKFSLIFKSNFQLPGDIRINVWVMSLPVVVIVHGSQEPQSWATITWDNAFSVTNRIPFQVPDKVDWSHMVRALNMKFTCQTGRGLTMENLNYLCEKAFRVPISFESSHMPITWFQFCKEPLPELTFTFWDWFYAAMKLTKEHLLGPWSEGLIVGFVSKRVAEEKLLQCPAGTFLLRFSDSSLGGIVITWVTNNPMPTIVMVKPFCGKDLSVRSLGDIIKDLRQCVTLYPNIPKDSAFRKYYSRVLDSKSRNGYVSPILTTSVPDQPNMMLSNPNVAQNTWQSLDHTADVLSLQSNSTIPNVLPNLDEFMTRNSNCTMPNALPNLDEFMTRNSSRTMSNDLPKFDEIMMSNSNCTMPNILPNFDEIMMMN